MNPLVERKGFKIESTVSQKKKTKDKKSKGIDHVHIIDDDAPIPWDTTTTTTTTIIKPDALVNDDIDSVEDAPIVVGVLDERPAETREKERFKDAKRWRTKAFEEVPDPSTIGPQPKPKKSSRRKQNSSDDSDPEIDRRRPRKTDDPDLSPPRRKTDQNDDDPSPPRRRPRSNDDPSPPRRRDLSPPRRKHKPNDDLSPPRQRDVSPSGRQHQRNDDSSSSRHRDKSLPSHRRNDRHSRQESSPPSSHRRQPKEEPSSPPPYRRQKQESSPPPAQPAKSERRRLAEHKEKVAERYTQWGRGLAQVRQTEDAVKDYLEQAEKPLARYRDDNDLDAMLKQKEREDDPMLKYLSKKPSDEGDLTNNRAPAKPRYRGPDPQKNRFDIWPGYRWDGVDRSNGYERKLFESIASKHAKTQEAYLWSVEDM